MTAYVSIDYLITFSFGANILRKRATIVPIRVYKRVRLFMNY